MSKLDELIKELCSNGVEYKELKDLCEIKTGKLNANEMEENGIYPFFTCDEIPYKINKYAFDNEAILISGNGSKVGHINYYKGKFNAYQRTYVLLNFNSGIVKYFVFYLKEFLKKYIIKNSNKASVPYITLPMLEKFLIPIPPLEVQNEIVRILDNFTALTAELTAELTARKKQYSWYRDYLLKFENKIKIVKLKDIATEMYRGNGIKREEIREIGIPCVRYGEIYTDYGISFEKTKSYTDENLITNKKYIDYGDILFAITGENVEEIGKSTAYIGKEKCLVGGDILVMKHKQNPVYLSYVLSTENAQKQKSKGKIKSKVVHTNATDIGEIEIPLPPLEVQKRIVKVLDNFEKICNDLNIGLPAEIEARQKQYEFYRNFLLTFKIENCTLPKTRQDKTRQDKTRHN